MIYCAVHNESTILQLGASPVSAAAALETIALAIGSFQLVVYGFSRIGTYGIKRSLIAFVGLVWFQSIAKFSHPPLSSLASVRSLGIEIGSRSPVSSATLPSAFAVFIKR